MKNNVITIGLKGTKRYIFLLLILNIPLLFFMYPYFIRKIAICQMLKIGRINKNWIILLLFYYFVRFAKNGKKCYNYIINVKGKVNESLWRKAIGLKAVMLMIARLH